jgi:hypothetical protein
MGGRGLLGTEEPRLKDCWASVERIDHLIEWAYTGWAAREARGASPGGGASRDAAADSEGVQRPEPRSLRVDDWPMLPSSPSSPATSPHRALLSFHGWINYARASLSRVEGLSWISHHRPAHPHSTRGCGRTTLITVGFLDSSCFRLWYVIRSWPGRSRSTTISDPVALAASTPGT